MAWQRPRFSFLNIGFDTGIGNISSKNAVDSDYPLDFIIDGRQGDPSIMDSAATDHWLQINRTAGGLEVVNRLILGANHNYDGENIRLRASTDAAVTAGVDTLIPQTAVTGSAMLDYSFTANSKQYITLDWPSSTSTAWETTEFWVTRMRELTIGPGDGWRDEPVFIGEEFTKASGVVAHLETGPARRFFQLVYNWAGQSAASDHTILNELITTVRLSRPFILDPPFDDESALVMKFMQNQPPQREFDFPTPSSGTKAYRYTLPMLEHIA